MRCNVEQDYFLLPNFFLEASSVLFIASFILSIIFMQVGQWEMHFLFTMYGN